ncbi:hypothetical protein [Streptomyces canus]|uniref:hypothetical protein n=1 Tax=Streptomyces canus TaxID=58343 RepID=UPI0030E41A4E
MAVTPDNSNNTRQKRKRLAERGVLIEPEQDLFAQLRLWPPGGLPTSPPTLAARGGGVIAPCLTVPRGPDRAARHAHRGDTWIATVPAAANAVGGATAGIIVDGAGGVIVTFVMAGTLVAIAGLTAAWPSGPITRTDSEAEEATSAGATGDTSRHAANCEVLTELP